VLKLKNSRIAEKSSSLESEKLAPSHARVNENTNTNTDTNSTNGIGISNIGIFQTRRVSSLYLNFIFSVLKIPIVELVLVLVFGIGIF